MHKTIEKYFSGSLSEQEKDTLFKEMDTDNELRMYFVEMQNNYSLAQMLNEDYDSEYAQKRLLQFKKNNRRKTLRRRALTISKYAAILLIAVGIFSIFKFGNTSETIQKAEYIEYNAPLGLRKSITLSDGTKVYLAPSSKIKVPTQFAKDLREVMLDGEALFDVRKDKSRPFIVKTERYDIKVLGTIFMVNSYSKTSAFKTSLLEGSVHVYNNSENILLKPGESALFDNNKLITGKNNDREFYYLQSGVYQFNNKTLSEIADLLGKWYNVNIKVSNPQLSKKRLSGKFRESDNIDSILNAMQAIHPFTYKKKENDEIEIY